MAEFDCIVYSKIDTAAVIRLNMPETGNRIGLKAVTEIQNAMEKANSDPIVKSIIITGTGEYFCAGAAANTTYRSLRAKKKYVLTSKTSHRRCERKSFCRRPDSC